MAQHVEVRLGERSYPIRIGRDLAASTAIAGEEGLRALIVSDSHVDPLYGEARERALAALGFACARAVVPAGEPTKELAWVARLYEQAAAAGLDRRSVIVALGGGMVGDLAGFVAATYLRGVRLLQMPTTLLAMVDSSVGGKTGVNLPQGKNVVGAFHQPVEVVADLATLDTLPEREYASGLAEVVKYGVIWDAALFQRVEQHAEALLRRDPQILEAVVARCCEIKAEVVAIDERERGPRAILNFGHTLGHALEQAEGYGVWLHGEAVAVGMAFAAVLSVRRQGLAAEECDRLIGLLRRLGLPVSAPPGAGRAAWESVRAGMAADKKTRGGQPRFVLARRLGEVVTGCEVAEEALREAWHVCSQ